MYMAERAYEQGREFAVAHCNFSLRGDESDIDEKFVRRWCLERGVWYFCKKFDTLAYASENGISVEMAARDLRYEWFAELCREQSFEAVAVAHNANDNAETLMLNLLRGTGGRGLRGMSDERTMNTGLTIIRPLLGISRREIHDWMMRHGCSWREDRTNTDTRFKRNLIRQQVFPLFEKVNPSYLDTFASEMRHFAQENDIAEEYFTIHKDEVTDGDNIIISALMGLKHWKYVLFRLLEDKGMNEDSLENLIATLEKSGGRNIAGKRFGSIITASDRLIVSQRDSAAQEVETSGRRNPVADEIRVDGPGEYGFGGRLVRISTVPRCEIKSLICPEGVLYADSDALPFPFALRKWKDGDWMKPFGMRGRKKISDLFVDLKWSLPEKENAILVAKDGTSRVVALLGARIDDSVKVTEITREVVVLESVLK